MIELIKHIRIAIPLKGGRGKQVELNENFVKVIEHEYAVRYCEYMGVNPTVKMISNVLKTAPLSSCEMTSGWNNSGWLADVLHIYPNKAKKYTFEDDLQAKQREKALDLNAAKKHLGSLDVNKPGRHQKEEVVNDLYNSENFASSINRNVKSQQELIRKHQKDASKHIKQTSKLEKLSNQAKKSTKPKNSEGADTTGGGTEDAKEKENKKKELNFNFDEWKHKFIYPYLKGINESIKCEDESGKMKDY
jgi:hypothetical protein